LGTSAIAAAALSLRLAPLDCLPIELPSLERTEGNHPGQPFVPRQAAGHIERHPVLGEI
jgi:hypothetical protein